MAESDFNPGFSFDFGGNSSAQAPWDFSGTLKQALDEQGETKLTSIEQKIQRRLQENERIKAAVKRAQDILKAKNAKKVEKEDGSDDEDEDSEDEPLPGPKEAAAKNKTKPEAPPAVQEAAPKNKTKPEAPQVVLEAAPKTKTKSEALQAVQEERKVEAKQRAQQNTEQPKGKGGFFAETPDGTSFGATSFADLNLSRPLIKACAALGYTTPTPIQAACIPLALTGRDICGSAITGSGKTAAFALPILERLIHRPRQVAATYVLVLSPTRELAVQIHSMMQKLGQFTDVQVALVVGGLSSQVQAGVLRKSPEIVVATPGRMIDHLQNTQSVGLEDLSVLVLDEADRLLEMGFKDELQEIIRMTPKKRQTMLFSATFSEEVKKLVALSLKSPVRLAADAAASVPSSLTQEIVRLKGADMSAQKEAMLMAVCSRSFKGGRTIVFFKTKQGAHRARILFGLCKLAPGAELHGDMTQTARLESLERFRTGEASFLLCTDVVVNYDAPSKLETYLHRIGRTARAGAGGQSVTFIEDSDRGLVKEVVKRTKAQMQQRVVPPQSIEQWQAKLESLTHSIASVIHAERMEKEMRQAEMAANKMQNMMDHEDEIKSRPKRRTWFQTEREKKELAKQTADMAAGQEDGDRYNDEDGPAAKKHKGDKEGDKQDRRAQKKLERAAEEKKNKRDALKTETDSHTRAIKSAKSKMRHMVQAGGMTSGKAAKLYQEEAHGGRKKERKKEKAGDGPAKLFSGDGLKSGGGKGGAGKGSSGSSGGKDKKQMSKTELNKQKRGGTGKAAFKSKKKFKRR
eukprot:gene4052-14138_t